jgi:hypothetical protein
VLIRGGVCAFILLAVLTTTAAAQSTPTPSDDPQHVVDRFELARGAGDVDAALANLADTAVITIQSQTSARSFTGSVQLRGYLQTIGTHFQTLMRSRPLVQGTSVTWTERDQVGNQVVDATVVAIVSAGQIVAITYRDTSPVGTPGRLAAASVPREQRMEIPTAIWPAGLGALGLLLITALFAWPRRKASRSQLDGRLLVALRQDRQVHFEERKKAA